MIAGISLAANNIRKRPIIDTFNYLELKNLIVDDVFITAKDVEIGEEYSTDWDYDTILHATYDGTINGGNVSFAISSVDFIRLKRRKRGSYKWDVLYENAITSADDFNFEFFDRFCRSNQTYEYAIVCVASNIEGQYLVNAVDSKFEDFFVCEKEKGYPIGLNLSFSHQPNRESEVVPTLARKYPFVINTGSANYASGTFSGTFISKSGEDYTDDDIEQGWKYREEVNEFLNDGKPKIIKHYDGRMYLVSVVSVDEDHSQHYLMPVHSVRFVEIGNCEDMESLYENGLIDYNYSTDYLQ